MSLLHHLAARYHLNLYYFYLNRVFQKEYAKIITHYVKNEKHYKILVLTYVLPIHSSFVLCFTSAHCGHRRQHIQHQADMRILTKSASEYVAVHCMDCSCYSIIYVIDTRSAKRYPTIGHKTHNTICWKWWNINLVFNIIPQERHT